MDTNILKGIMLVVLIAITVVSIPFIIDSQEDTERDIVFTQNVNETVNVFHTIDGTLEDINSNDEIAVTVTDNDTQETELVSNLSEQNSSIVSFEGGNITVTNENITDNTAKIRYAYDQQYGWSDGEKRMLNVLGIMISVILLLVVVFTFTSIMGDSNGE